MPMGWGYDNPRDEYYAMKNREAAWGHPGGLLGILTTGIFKLLIKTWFIWVPLIIISALVTKCNNAIESNKQRAQPVQQVQPFVYVNTDGLNMRSAASSQADVVTILHRDDKVEIIGKTDNESWIKVRFGNYEGFVNLNYLRK